MVNIMSNITFHLEYFLYSAITLVICILAKMRDFIVKKWIRSRDLLDLTVMRHKIAILLGITENLWGRTVWTSILSTAYSGFIQNKPHIREIWTIKEEKSHNHRYVLA